MEKNKLFLKGQISEEEVSEISQDLSNNDFVILKYSGQTATISGIHDIVNLIFDDLRPLSFLRDYFIGKIIDISYSMIKQVIAKLREKEKFVNDLTIIRQYHKEDGGIIFLKFSAKVDKFEKLINEINENLTYDFLEAIESGKNVSFVLDSNEKLYIGII